MSGVLNWGVCGTEGFFVWEWEFFGVELRVFLLLNRGVFGAELRGTLIYILNRPPQFNTSVLHKRPFPFQPQKFLSSTPKTPQFNKPPSVPHEKLLSSNPSPQFHTEHPSVPHKKPLFKRALQFFSQTERALWNSRKFYKFNSWRPWLRARWWSRKNA